MKKRKVKAILKRKYCGVENYRSDLRETSFFLHVGHSLLPARSAVVIHS